MSPAPTSETHPKLHLWMLAKGLNNRAGGELFGVSHETVRLWRLPFADPKRQKPGSDELVGRVMAKTDGQITAGDWYPPRLRAPVTDPRGGDPAVLRHARAH